MYRIKEFFRKLCRFYYYGKVGMSCVPYDANCVDDLILAHIRAVEKFMDSDDTHTLWSSKERGLKRKLREFKRLCEMKVKNTDFNDHYESSKIYNKYGPREFINLNDGFLTLSPMSEERKIAANKAFLLDKKRADSRRKRYYQLLEHYVPGFWD